MCTCENCETALPLNVHLMCFPNNLCYQFPEGATGYWKTERAANLFLNYLCCCNRILVLQVIVLTN